MPNWCNNNITISGPTETIKQLWDDAQNSHRWTEIVDGKEVEKIGFGLLEAMAPIGEWDYETAVESWGTKWDISDEGLEIIEHGDGTAEITGWFESAWAPPIEAYNRFLDDMDNCSLEASYHEPGMDFAGFYVNGDDEYLDNLHEEFKLPEDERSDLYNRLDEEYNLSENYDMWEEDEEMLEDE
jgi:hypothetical protein